MAKDQLFLLTAPFEDRPGEMWFCADCALMEGALLANPHWEDRILVRRCAFPRPRQEILEMLGENNQGMPALIFGDPARATANAEKFGGYSFITDPGEITAYLAKTYGGAGPHP